VLGDGRSGRKRFRIRRGFTKLLDVDGVSVGVFSNARVKVVVRSRDRRGRSRRVQLTANVGPAFPTLGPEVVPWSEDFD
jgi:hypothetical protein